MSIVVLDLLITTFAILVLHPTMGLNGKEKPEKDSSKPPFKTGTFRASSATAGEVSIKKEGKTKFHRLRRSHSVEPTEARAASSEKAKRPSDLGVTASKAFTAERHLGSGGDAPRKRPPFSFSSDFRFKTIAHHGGEDDSSSGSEQNSHRPQFPQIQFTNRSPRVHFADETDDTRDPAQRDQIREEFTGSHDAFSTAEKPNDRIQEDAKNEVNQANEDDYMIAKTDNLILEVARFITDIKSTRVNTQPLDRIFESAAADLKTIISSRNSNPPSPNHLSNIFESSMENAEQICNVEPPSCLTLDSARSTNTTFCSPFPSPGMASFVRDSNIHRPASASLLRSVSNEDIHGRIALTLQMIEQEEQRDLRHSVPLTSPLAVQVEQEKGRDQQLPSSPGPSSFSSSEYGARHSLDLNPSPNIGNFDNEPLQTEPKNGIISNHQNVASSVVVKNTTDFFSARVVQPQLLRNTNLQLSQTQRNEVHAADRNQDPQNVLSEDKTKKIFSFLDEVEKVDREALLALSCSSSHPPPILSSKTSVKPADLGANLPFLQRIDSLIRKGSVELAKEQIIIERKLEEAQQRIQILEETLIHQREHNMRNLKNSEHELRKRLRLQKEEFDVAFTRNEALINEMVAEKRVLQERLDKLMRQFDETEEKYKEQIRNLQQKHLEEIKRLRKAQINSEQQKKQQWVGSKTQEIRELTVKGLEPEVQRIIQRHHQEMNEMRSWHTDEIREVEEKYQRKIHMQAQEMRDKFAREAEQQIQQEKEVFAHRLESTLQQREEEFETQRRRLLMEIDEERQRMVDDENKMRQKMQEAVRRAEIKGELEVENLRKEYETKFANAEAKHASEIKSLKDIHETELQTLKTTFSKKLDAAVKEKENEVSDSLKGKMEIDFREREKKLKEEFEKIRKEEEIAADARIRRLQEKFSADLNEMDDTEKELKTKLNQSKSELLAVEEQLFSVRTAVSIKQKQNDELQEINAKMHEERANLTSIIRREFTSQMEELENEIQGLKSTLVELQAKHRLEMEQAQLNTEKVSMEKDAEIEKIAVRVQQTIGRKDETIQGLQKQIEKLNFQIDSLEAVLEEQRKTLVDSITKSSGSSKRK